MFYAGDMFATVENVFEKKWNERLDTLADCTAVTGGYVAEEM